MGSVAIPGTEVTCECYGYHPHPAHTPHSYHVGMVLKIVNLGLTAAQLRRLDKLAEKLQLDRTNTLRYCIAKTAELEKIK